MNQFSDIDKDDAWADDATFPFPEDFSEEEQAFALEMRAFFAVDGEELPPLYAQTLLDDAASALPVVGLEQRITRQVFDQLRLTRDILPASTAPAASSATSALTRFSMLRQPKSLLQRLRSRLVESYDYFNRPLTACASVAVLLMALTVALATPAFAQGLRYIFGNTGVVQVQKLPANTENAPLQTNNDPDRNLQFDSTMPTYWLGSVVADAASSTATSSTTSNYVYQGVRLHEPTQWSKGPIVDIQYALSNASQGSGILDIREFQVADTYSAVLQVVQTGSVTSLALADGESAAYVNGTWIQHWLDHTTIYTWQSGNHCLFVLERQGVVIWMTGDPRDGLTAAVFANLANQLVAINPATLTHASQRIRWAGESLVTSLSIASGLEVYDLVPQNISPESGMGQFVFSGQSVTALTNAGTNTNAGG